MPNTTTTSRSYRLKTPQLLLGTALVGAHWLLSGLPEAHAEIYQYIDANGTISLTNVPTDLRYRRITTQSNRLHPVLSERELEPMISRYSRRHQLHPALIRAVIKAESGFDPMAVSRAGAIGLMQLMPQTAVRLEVRDLYDPEDNIGGGTKYLRQLLDRFRGNLPLALAAYNAGEHTVDRYRGLPPIDETRQYVRKVIRYYRTFLIKDGLMAGHVIAAAESAAPQPPPASLPASAQ
ncbi:MAG: lytic transglycosylase domain-containing protein [Nitrospira sp.]|nr:lytic transglycosylase domain-containing protein [Nitrospira sp.]